jgi:hypothetical protein
VKSGWWISVRLGMMEWMLPELRSPQNDRRRQEKRSVKSKSEFQSPAKTTKWFGMEWMKFWSFR